MPLLRALLRLPAAFAVLMLTVPLAAGAQSANFRAQAKYYSAKEAYEAGRHADAITLVTESKALLSGGSNDLLQYLHVMAAYKAGRFKEAQKEMTRFFDLVERREQSTRFARAVDELTDDEVRAVTMLLDKIDAEVANDTEGRRRAEADRAAAISAFRRAWTEFTALIVTEHLAAPALDADDGTPLTHRTRLHGEPEALTLEHTETQNVRDMPYFPQWRVGTKFSATARFSLLTVRDAVVDRGTFPQQSGSNNVRGRVDAAQPVLRFRFPERVTVAIAQQQAFWGGGEPRSPQRYQSRSESSTDAWYELAVPVRDGAAALLAFQRVMAVLPAYKAARGL